MNKKYANINIVIGKKQKLTKEQQNCDVLCVTMFKDKKDKKIADLEAKLAESEKDRLMWQEMYKSADKQNKEICETDIYPLQEQIQQLKQQLAEKDQAIEGLQEINQSLGHTCNNDAKEIERLREENIKLNNAIDKRNEEISNLQRIKNNLSKENHNLIKKK